MFCNVVFHSCSVANLCMSVIPHQKLSQATLLHKLASSELYAVRHRLYPALDKSICQMNTQKCKQPRRCTCTTVSQVVCMWYMVITTFSAVNMLRKSVVGCLAARQQKSIVIILQDAVLHPVTNNSVSEFWGAKYHLFTFINVKILLIFLVIVIGTETWSLFQFTSSRLCFTDLIFTSESTTPFSKSTPHFKPAPLQLLKSPKLAGSGQSPQPRSLC